MSVAVVDTRRGAIWMCSASGQLLAFGMSNKDSMVPFTKLGKLLERADCVDQQFCLEENMMAANILNLFFKIYL